MTTKAATANKQENGSDLRRTFGLFRRYKGGRKVYFAGILFLIVEAAMAIVEAFPIAYLIDFLQGSKPSLTVSFGIPNFTGSEQLGTILILTIAIIGIAAVSSAADSLTEVCMARGGRSLGYSVRVAMYSHLQRLPLAYHDSKRTGDVLTRVTGDVLVLEDFIVGSVSNIMKSLLVLVGTFTVLFLQSPNVALIALVAVPMLSLLSNFFSRRIKSASKTQRSREGELASTTQEMLTSIRLVQSYGRGKVDLDRFSSQTSKSMQASLTTANIQAQFSFVVAIAEALAICAVIWLGTFLVGQSALTVGTLVLFVLLLQNMFKPARKIVSEWYKIGKVFASVERIDDLLGRDVGVKDIPGARPAPPLRGGVTFRNVTFAYPVEHEDGSDKTSRPAVLTNVSFDVAPGEVVSIAGSSGAGKSTIAQLIPRLYDPDFGEVLVDGMPLRALTLASLRSQVSLVLQETMLLSGSVAENIGYGIDDASHEDIEAAARRANAHDFIMELPEGYDTELGERGSTLSGGQRQRISIARAFIRHAPILILDEPTTGLDADSSQAVITALRDLMHGQTTILISHDPALIESADRVLHLADGQIVETRTPGSTEPIRPTAPLSPPADIPTPGIAERSPIVVVPRHVAHTGMPPGERHVTPDWAVPIANGSTPSGNGHAEPNGNGHAAAAAAAAAAARSGNGHAEETAAAAAAAASIANAHAEQTDVIAMSNGNGHVEPTGSTALTSMTTSTDVPADVLHGLARRIPDVVRALDHDFVARRVAPSLLEPGLAVEEVAVEKMWLRSAAAFALRYRLQLSDGTDGYLLATVHADGRDAVNHLDQEVRPLVAESRRSRIHPWRELAALVDGTRIVVHPFPIDPGLPTLSRAIDPAVVGRLARTELGVNADPTVEVVRYPREGSCVMRYDFAGSMSLYGKVYADDSGLIVESFLNAMDRAQADDRHVTESRYPSPVLFDRALKLLVTSELAGEPLAERISRALAADDDEDAAPPHPELESAVHAAGRALAALHDSDMATAPTYTVTQELDDLRRQLQMVTYTWPNLGKDLRRHVELLTAVAPSAPDLVLSHGDFTPSQVLMDDDRPALVDLDGLCWADPTRDLGRFMAQLDLLVSKTRGTRSRSTVEDLVDAFLRGYRDGNPRVDHDPGFASRVAFYRRASLLRSALHARRQLKPARHDLAMSLFASQGMPSGGNRA